MVEKPMKSSKTKNLIGVVIPILLLVGVVVGVNVISTGKTGVFELRKKASTPEGKVKLSLGAERQTVYLGDVFPISVMVDTNGEKLSSITFRLTFPYNKTARPVFDVVDSSTGNPSNSIASNTAGVGSGLTASVNAVQRQSTSGNILIDFSAITTNVVGFTTPSGSPVLLATIWMKANGPTPGSVTLTADNKLSVARKKDGNTDTLGTITGKTLVLGNDTAQPKVVINSGPTEGSVLNDFQAVTLKWSGTDTPDRITGTKIPLLYQYRWNGGSTVWSAKSSNTTATLTTPIHGSYAFEVRVHDGTGNIGSARRSFSVNLRPTISNFDPKKGPEGTAVTITGNNFLTKGTKSAVYFGATAATITSWSDTKIVVKAPANGGIIKVVNSNNLSGSSTDQFGSETLLRVIIPLEGITRDAGEKLATIVMKNGTKVWKFVDVKGTWSSTNVAYMFTTDPITPTVTAGSAYTVSIKEKLRLRRKFTAVAIKPNTINVVLKKTAADKLLSADVAPGVWGDNNITVEDFSFCMSQITEFGQAAESDNQKRCDLDGNGKLEIHDISLILTNYKALENKGSDE
jgi:hypothetical protein